MKKIKIMLTAAIVVAAVGGALAFKAQKGTFLYCSDTKASGSGISCPTFTNLYTYENQTPLTNTFCGTAITSCDQDVRFE